LSTAGRYLVRIVLFWLAVPARMAFRAHLTQPQLSQHLLDLLGEHLRQIETCVPVRHGAHVDEDPLGSCSMWPRAVVAMTSRSQGEAPIRGTDHPSTDLVRDHSGARQDAPYLQIC
jgi:hypothetical protein